MQLEYIFAAIIISKWFSILREPDQLFSWYNRMLIGWDYDTSDIQYLRNDKNAHDLYLFFYPFINLVVFISYNFKPFFYKVFTCSLCHSGYLAIYFIFVYKAHFIILPTTMVVYYLLSKIKFQ